MPQDDYGFDMWLAREEELDRHMDAREQELSLWEDSLLEAAAAAHRALDRALEGSK